MSGTLFFIFASCEPLSLLLMIYSIKLYIYPCHICIFDRKQNVTEMAGFCKWEQNIQSILMIIQSKWKHMSMSCYMLILFNQSMWTFSSLVFKQKIKIVLQSKRSNTKNGKSILLANLSSGSAPFLFFSINIILDIEPNPDILVTHRASKKHSLEQRIPWDLTADWCRYCIPWGKRNVTINAFKFSNFFKKIQIFIITLKFSTKMHSNECKQSYFWFSCFCKADDNPMDLTADWCRYKIVYTGRIEM